MQTKIMAVTAFVFASVLSGSVFFPADQTAAAERLPSIIVLSRNNMGGDPLPHMSINKFDSRFYSTRYEDARGELLRAMHQAAEDAAAEAAKIQRLKSAINGAPHESMNDIAKRWRYLREVSLKSTT